MLITKEILLAMGFDCKTPAELESKSGQAPHKHWWTKDGDDIYIHQEKNIWFQGIPQPEQLFSIVFLAGRKDGISNTRHEIRKSLGL